MRTTILPVLAATLLVSLMLSVPVFAHPISALSVSPSTVTSGQTFTVSGTASTATAIPAGSNAFIQVTNPTGTLVAASVAAITSSSGAFSATFTAGGTATWTTGSYTATATFQDSPSDTASTSTATFTFTSTGGVAGAGGTTLSVTLTGTSQVFAGQKVNVFALVQWSNGSLAAVTSWPVAHYHTPAATTTQIGSPTTIHAGMYLWSIDTTGLADGTYAVHVAASAANALAQGLGTFTVNSQVASASSVTALQTALTSAQSSLSTISSSLTTLSSTLTTVASGISSIQSTLSGFTTSLTNVQNAATSASTAVSSVSGKVDSTLSAVQSSQTYVLVVAALAAITLVLELAILVRKLS